MVSFSTQTHLAGLSTAKQGNATSRPSPVNLNVSESGVVVSIETWNPGENIWFAMCHLSVNLTRKTPSYDMANLGNSCYCCPVDTLQ